LAERVSFSEDEEEKSMKATIFLAGGCFWGMQAYFDQVKGVLETTVGYANGTTAFPRYEEVKTGKTGHAETLRIVYDDEVTSLEKLLELYLRAVDPYSVNRQGEDEGSQYRTGIYYTDLLDGIRARTYLQRPPESRLRDRDPSDE
jgi:methionine-S-sulfoxide reductase